MRAKTVSQATGHHQTSGTRLSTHARMVAMMIVSRLRTVAPKIPGAGSAAQVVALGLSGIKLDGPSEIAYCHIDGPWPK